MSNILLLTGLPGIGKTTLIHKVAAEMRQHQIGGFYTEEIRQGGRRQGFRLVTFNGKQGIIAHVDFDHRYRVGKYGVDVVNIDRLADTTLSVSEDTDFYLVDEIGKMECLAPLFVSRMEALLSSHKMIIATVGKKGRGLIERVKHWPRSQLWEITYENRDALAAQVIALIERRA